MNIKLNEVKIKYLLLLVFSILFIGSVNLKIVKAEALDTDIVSFPDANLEAAVRDKLVKPTGYITVGDMKRITGSFDAQNRNISHLGGREYAVNITDLDLTTNNIKDISQLSKNKFKMD